MGHHHPLHPEKVEEKLLPAAGVGEAALTEALTLGEDEEGQHEQENLKCSTRTDLGAAK